ncbi:hypothetical protein [Streptomyces sp. NPDC088400]|uniref:hypothetical protein n=1 Tax=Streptomyces sp. NPDC088400 TaxID=3365861 RepID=UPI0038084515
MISRAPLPPSPPPEELRSWPDHEALLADRAEAMVGLTRRGLGFGRLLALWLTGLVAVVGWAAAGLAIQSFEQGGLGYLTGLVTLALAAVLLTPAGVGIGFWLSRGRTVRQRLDEWAELGAEPGQGLAPGTTIGVRVRAHGRCVIWLLPSVLLCVVAVWSMFQAVTGAGPGSGVGPASGAGPDAGAGPGAWLGSATVGEMAYALGWMATFLATGVLGIVQAVRHQHWSERLLSPVPVRRGGGAHR